MACSIKPNFTDNLIVSFNISQQLGRAIWTILPQDYRKSLCVSGSYIHRPGKSRINIKCTGMHLPFALALNSKMMCQTNSLPALCARNLESGIGRFLSPVMETLHQIDQQWSKPFTVRTLHYEIIVWTNLGTIRHCPTLSADNCPRAVSHLLASS